MSQSISVVLGLTPDTIIRHAANTELCRRTCCKRILGKNTGVRWCIFTFWDVSELSKLLSLSQQSGTHWDWIWAPRRQFFKTMLLSMLANVRQFNISTFGAPTLHRRSTGPVPVIWQAVVTFQIAHKRWWVIQALLASLAHFPPYYIIPPTSIKSATY
jgi:hypothetical protein